MSSTDFKRLSKEMSGSTGIFGSMLIANIMFFVLGFFGAKIFARITLVPNQLLWPMIFAVTVCGTYSLIQ